MLLNGNVISIRALIIGFICVSLSGNPCSASEMNVEALAQLGLVPFPQEDSLLQETFAGSVFPTSYKSLYQIY